ncbi:PREDICTED: receptor-like protein 12 [Nelumbo nucifera]|uniref:Leucine-rich repeat-containing N-terminal plant-type domain-containing protein n=2 Tax=Nelumbo nucifera TaxID=4432 RepID=A0A822ZI38_NELNU|nr:PREDICTED: receptor-like protein 12 [Nelumbo nucifera]DAD42696.1 TPA_asm: hypothetical protein HUJ06_000926 [Nelumbo nucifera]
MMGISSLVTGILFILCMLSRESICINVDGIPYCLESDWKALVDFKKALIDPENRLSSWEGSNCCQWRGVSCNNHTGAVIGIDLHNPYPYDPYFDDDEPSSNSRYGFWNLSGQIDPALLRLKSLKHLDLSGNTFQGIPIPEFLGSLKGLRYLNLSTAGFRGVIPANLGNLSSLRYLDISSEFHPYLLFLPTVNFTQRLADIEWISGLRFLRHLGLNGVDLSLVGSKWIQVPNMLSSLTELHLSDCGLSGVIPSLRPQSVINFTSLAVIDLSFNNFNSEIPNWILNVSSLVHVDLRGNRLHGRIPLGISELPKLKYLDLSWNQNLSASCSQLFRGSWRKIESLELSNNRIHGKLPASIGNMTCLVHLELYRNNISGRIPRSIANLCKLSSLDLGRNKLVGTLPDWSVQLKNLQVLYLDGNLFKGPILAALERLPPQLTSLFLAGNEFNGSLPDTLVGRLSELVSLDVSSNHLTGTVSEAHFSNLTKLKYLDMSSNSLTLNVSSKWVPPFKLHSLEMGSCMLGPSFPAWLQTQTELTYLDISNASISGSIPHWFWNLSSNIRSLNVSLNKLQGELPTRFKVASSWADVDFSSNLLEGPIPLPTPGVFTFDLSNNQFSGPIPSNIGDVLPNLYSLFLSNNHIIGQIPTSIGKIPYLGVVALSRNNLTGTIPSSLANCSDLMVLDLKQNHLSGLIPRSFGHLKWLQSLHLSDNMLFGDLPMSMQNCTILETLDLGSNNFSGEFPSWIGESLPALRILRLRSNSFSSRIPAHLSNLSSLQVLDLADNNLIGSIPTSLASLEAMAHVQNLNRYLYYGASSTEYYEESLNLPMKGQDLTFTKTLSLVTCIDLSNNELNGEFPEVLTNLSGLISLNLSGNHIGGEIPTGIANLHQLLSLDVSNNQLSGVIPSSMSSMTFLSSLNLSNNNLSGSIPFSGQLMAFDESSFNGNPGLCGPQLLIKCQDDDEEPKGQAGSVEDESSNDHEVMNKWFYLSAGLGFAAGLLVPFAVMALRRSWSDAYFHLVDQIVDGIMLDIMRSNKRTSQRKQRRHKS